MNIINHRLLMLLFLVSVMHPAYGFYVDKMFIEADENGNGVITLVNNEERPLFINSTVEEFTILNGDKISRQLYKSKNIDNWKISLTHPKLVLRQGESRDVGIRSLCFNTSCDSSKDLMFFVTFIPSTYKGEDENKSNGVEINYGFSTVYIIPTKTQSIDYDVRYIGDEVIIENNSNTALELIIDSCSDDFQDSCLTKQIVVSGRTKSFAVAAEESNESVVVEISSSGRQYSNELRLTRE